MATLKRKTPKGYATAAIPIPVHREMRIYLASNPQFKGLGHLIAYMWQGIGRREKPE